MAGYSQGGQLVHNAAAMLDSTTSSKVAGAVIFGDPSKQNPSPPHTEDTNRTNQGANRRTDNGKPVQGISNTKVICHTGDNICAGGDLILAPHLTYGADANTAAAFAAAA
jgi:cutinase